MAMGSTSAQSRIRRPGKSQNETRTASPPPTRRVPAPTPTPSTALERSAPGSRRREVSLKVSPPVTKLSGSAASGPTTRRATRPPTMVQPGTRGRRGDPVGTHFRRRIVGRTCRDMLQESSWPVSRIDPFGWPQTDLVVLPAPSRDRDGSFAPRVAVVVNVSAERYVWRSQGVFRNGFSWPSVDDYVGPYDVRGGVGSQEHDQRSHLAEVR